MNEKRTPGFVPVLILVVLVLVLGSWLMRALRPVGLPYSQVLEQFEQENVRSFLVKDGVLQLELYRPLYGESSAIAYLDDTDAFRRSGLSSRVQIFREAGPLVFKYAAVWLRVRPESRMSSRITTCRPARSTEMSF